MNKPSSFAKHNSKCKRNVDSISNENVNQQQDGCFLCKMESKCLMIKSAKMNFIGLAIFERK